MELIVKSSFQGPFWARVSGWIAMLATGILVRTILKPPLISQGFQKIVFFMCIYLKKSNQVRFILKKLVVLGERYSKNETERDDLAMAKAL